MAAPVRGVLLLSLRSVEAMAAWGTAASWFVRKSSSEISPEKLPALPLRRRSVLLHDGGLQPQAEAAATG